MLAAALDQDRRLPEDCGYCSQSAHSTPADGARAASLKPLDEVVAAARGAKENGADRFCMGAAWREVKDGPEFERVLDMVREVKALGLETCVHARHADRRPGGAACREAGLDYYNHNLDTGAQPLRQGRLHAFLRRTPRRPSPHVRTAGMHVCCGGILGLGETRHAHAPSS